MLQNRTEDEFTLPRSVASVDNFRDRFVLNQFHDGRELLFSSAPFGFVLKGIGNIGEAVDGVSPVLERLIIIVHVL